MRLKALALLLLGSAFVSAQNYQIRTIAGVGTYGGDGGPATSALINPFAAVVDASGNIYVSDDTYRIRKIVSSGIITTLIGKGYSAFSGDGGPASAATMSTASALAIDSVGDLYFADSGNNRIREVTTAGMVRTVAGTGTCGTTAPGAAATQAPLCDVEGVAIDTQGRVYFSSNSRIWMIAADGSLILIAGTGGATNTGDGGLATSAEIGLPTSIAIDASGNLYFADAFNLAIREVTPDKLIHTSAKITDTSATGIVLALDNSGQLYYTIGTQRVYKLVQGAPVLVATLTGNDRASYIAIDRSGALYLSSFDSSRVLKVNGIDVTTIAGAYPFGVDPLPKPATSAHLHLNPLLIGLAVDASGNVYFPELDGNLVQRIDVVSPSGTMTALPTPVKLPTGGAFDVQSVTVGPGGMIYFSTFTQVYRAELNGSVTLIAGAPGFPSNVGDGGPATAAKISNPTGIVFDQSGNLYITEPFDSRVRKVTPQNVISTFAGTGHAGNSGDNGPAAAALVSTPVDVKVDSNGNVFIADLTAAVVRKVSPNGIITTVAGNGSSGFSGDGGPALKAQISGAAAIAVDPSGNLFIADQPSAGSTISPAADNNRIRMVDTAGVITTVAGGVFGYNGEGILAAQAALGARSRWQRIARAESTSPSRILSAFAFSRQRPQRWLLRR